MFSYVYPENPGLKNLPQSKIFLAMAKALKLSALTESEREFKKNF